MLGLTSFHSDGDLDLIKDFFEKFTYSAKARAQADLEQEEENMEDADDLAQVGVYLGRGAEGRKKYKNQLVWQRDFSRTRSTRLMRVLLFSAANDRG